MYACYDWLGAGTLSILWRFSASRSVHNQRFHCRPCMPCLACSLPSRHLHVVSRGFGTAIPTSLYIFGQCFLFVTAIQCSHLYCFLPSDVAPPPQPSNVQYSVIFYGTSYLAGDIEWELFTSSPVDNFTITVSSLNGSPDLTHTVESSPIENVMLHYNTNYTVTVIGRNCGGSSIPAILPYMECEFMFKYLVLNTTIIVVQFYLLSLPQMAVLYLVTQ